MDCMDTSIGKCDVLNVVVWFVSGYHCMPHFLQGFHIASVPGVVCVDTSPVEHAALVVSFWSHFSQFVVTLSIRLELTMVGAVSYCR